MLQTKKFKATFQNRKKKDYDENSTVFWFSLYTLKGIIMPILNHPFSFKIS